MYRPRRVSGGRRDPATCCIRPLKAPTFRRAFDELGERILLSSYSYLFISLFIFAWNTLK